MEGAGLYPLGDAALLFEWPEGNTVLPGKIAAAAARLRGLDLPGVKEMVPAYRSLAVHLDLEKLARSGDPGGLPEAIMALAGKLLEALGAGGDDGSPVRTPRHVRIPVVYGGTEGPDLEACALRSRMTPEDFVRAHSSAVYELAMMGFAPGFPYLSGLPETLAQPRHETPRLRVPAGSVGIAGTQTGVYPVDSPGGWQIIGRTAVPLFCPKTEEPFLLSPGDRVSFVPVSEHDEKEVCGSRPRPALLEEADAGAVLEVIRPGLLTTVQDRGRSGWQAFGVSLGGAMDPDALRTANALVGNPEDAAVLEMTMNGAVFAVKRDLLAAFAGGGMEARLNGELLPGHRPVWLHAGTELAFGPAKTGFRTYMAVAGGFDVPAVLGSRSTDLRAAIGGLEGRSLQAGDRLPAGEPAPYAVKLAALLKEAAVRDGKGWAAVPWSAGRAPEAGHTVVLRVVEGAEWDAFGPGGQHILLESEFRVDASSDRMGLRLTGARIPWGTETELASHGVAPGTIQVPPSGLPILLGPGCQPTGGYAKIAHIISADLPLLGQCAPGTRMKFEAVGLETAWRAWGKRERDRRIMAAGLRLKGEGLLRKLPAKGADISWMPRSNESI